MPADLIIAVRGRGVRVCTFAYLVGTLCAIALALRPVPFTEVDGVGPVPSGILLLAVPVVSLGPLWRDATRPLASVAPHRSRDRVVVCTWSWAASAVATGAMSWRLAGSNHPPLIGLAMAYLGIGLVGSAIAGARTGTLVLAALMMATFAVAPIVAGRLFYGPQSSTVIVSVGTALLIAGTALALRRGTDPGRTS